MTKALFLVWTETVLELAVVVTIGAYFFARVFL